MKSKVLILGAICTVTSLLAACGGNDNGSSNTSTTTPPPTTTTPSGMGLDTAQVLALAQVTSETSAPFAVDGGAVTLDDSSETSSPIAVN